jgi:hypothetical protein
MRHPAGEWVTLGQKWARNGPEMGRKNRQKLDPNLPRVSIGKPPSVLRGLFRTLLRTIEVLTLRNSRELDERQRIEARTYFRGA